MRLLRVALLAKSGFFNPHFNIGFMALAEEGD